MESSRAAPASTAPSAPSQATSGSGPAAEVAPVRKLRRLRDAEVAVWRARPLDEQAFPYLFPDATYCTAVCAIAHRAADLLRAHHLGVG